LLINKSREEPKISKPTWWNYSTKCYNTSRSEQSAYSLLAWSFSIRPIQLF